jgi:hypothetical protein
MTYPWDFRTSFAGVLYDTDIRSHCLALGYTMTGTSTELITVTIQSTPGSGCELHLFESSQPAPLWRYPIPGTGAIFANQTQRGNEWVRQVVESGPSLQYGSTSSLHTFSDVLVQASLSKEQ